MKLKDKNIEDYINNKENSIIKVNKYLDSFTKVLEKKYSYLNISKEHIRLEVENKFNKFIKSSTDVNKFEKYFINKFDSYVIKMLESDKMTKVIENYIKDNKEILKSSFFNIITFFKEIKYYPSINIYTYLLTNHKEYMDFMDNELKGIIKERKEVYDGELEKYEDGYKITIVEAYLSIKNIEINTKISVDENSKIYTYGKNSTLGKEQEIKLMERIKEGDNFAKEIFIEHNIRSVIYIAKRYINNSYHIGIEDIIQEGCIGLMKAIDGFDLSKNYRFTTYSYFWIKQAIGRALDDQGRIIRHPVHLIERFNKVERFKKNFMALNGCEPTIEEIANGTNLTVKNIEYLDDIMKDTVSIDNKVKEDSDCDLGDFLISKNDNTEEEAINEMLREDIEKSFKAAGLNSREKDIMRYRTGLVDGNTYTLKEIGKLYGITRERTRQIEAIALRKLRNEHAAKFIIDYASYTGAYDRQQKELEENPELKFENKYVYKGVKEVEDKKEKPIEIPKIVKKLNVLRLSNENICLIKNNDNPRLMHSLIKFNVDSKTKLYDIRKFLINEKRKQLLEEETRKLKII